MSELRQLMLDAAGKLFAQHCTKEVVNDAEAGTWPSGLWSAMAAAGLPLAALSERAGGAGADWADAYAVLRLAARWAAPVPLAETMLAAWALDAAGLPVPDGPLGIAPVQVGDSLTLVDGRLRGVARRVPWARDVAALVVITDDGDLLLVKPLNIRPDRNLAGEPRDTVTFDSAAADAVRSAVSRAALFRRGALARSVQMAGALERVLELSVGYANDRVQFGRAIGKFQAIQQNLAVLAGQVAAAGAAADAAVEQPDGFFPVAAAKTRVGEAAGIAAGIAHQVHGAIGFTYEHQLHHATRRLWSWREEFGPEAYWAAEIGRQVAARGADQLWPFITAA